MLLWLADASQVLAPVLSVDERGAAGCSEGGTLELGRGSCFRCRFRWLVWLRGCFH